MQRTSFMLGVALLVVAATLAIVVTFRPAGTDSPATASDSSPRPGQVSDRSLAPPSPSTPGNPSATKTPHRADTRDRFSVTAPEGHPDGPRLAEQAQKVEAEATLHLQRLSEQLQLTGEQRRRLFPILARTSRHYHPALRVSGRPAGAPALPGPAGDREVKRVLDPQQKDQLIEDSLADLALWEEIIDKLIQRLDEETPKIAPADDSARPDQPESPTPPSRGRGNLFDRLDPQR